MSLNKKRLTITLEGPHLTWIDEKIKELIFHNYQHAVDYCIMKTYKQEHPE